MNFTGHEDHTVSLETAQEWTKRFRVQADPKAIRGGYFSKDALVKVLNQENAVGIRYYRGLTDDSTPVLILCGVDSDGNDLVDGLLLEYAKPCPPYCAESNLLNS